MRLVLATSNRGKLREFEALLAPLHIEVLPQSQFTSVSVEETGLTFVENAILKARHAASASGLPAIADDSGIEVDALAGKPGIYSARYAGVGASDEANLQKLLADLRDVPDSRLGARYWCALVYMRSAADPAPLVCQASWSGRLIRERRGEKGFGYDPIFFLPSLDVTAAQLSLEDKNRLSHRGQALRLLIEQLKLERWS